MGNKESTPQFSLTPAMFYVLLSLADGDKHGYAILKEVSQNSGGKVRLSAGTLYGVIRRLESEGLITESASRPRAALDDERRRYYRISPLGRNIAAAEAQRMEQLVDIARSKLLLRKTNPA
jgi:DNA-binding PadR family transcriptional regulator